MTIQEIIDYLLARIEDLNKDSWETQELLVPINNAVLKVANGVHSDLLIDELGVTDTDVDVTAGVINISDLSSSVLGGGARILQVFPENLPEAKKYHYADIRKLENTYYKPSNKRPVFYVFGGKIQVRPTTIAKVDVTFLKVPKPLLYDFTIAAHGTPSTTKFLGDAGQGLSAVDDYYCKDDKDENRVVIFCQGKNAYFIVTSYTGTTREFTVTAAADENFGTDIINFITHSFDQLNLDNINFELNESLRSLVLDFAEAEIRGAGDDQDKKIAGQKSAYAELEFMNNSYQKPRGGGNKSRR